MHAKTYFLKFSLFYENTIWFLALRDKNIFFNVFTKTGYFNTGFVFLQYKVQTTIKQNLVEKYTENYNFKKRKF
jgi:hypothetical protein